MPNINDNFFDGHYKKIWKDLIPDELTTKEIDFMLPYFELKEGSKVLDLMCGYGRHALALARKGISVTAIDNLPDYMQEIEKAALNEKLSVRTMQQSIIDLDLEQQFDLAICMGNSIQFFDATELKKIFAAINKSLVPGGQFLINSWSIAEIAIKNFKDRSWSEIGEYKFLVESKWQFSPSRIDIRSIIITPTGETEEKTSVDHIYSLNEMEMLLNEAGFKLKEVYSIPGRKKFSLGEPRAYLVAVKN